MGEHLSCLIMTRKQRKNENVTGPTRAHLLFVLPLAKKAICECQSLQHIGLWGTFKMQTSAGDREVLVYAFRNATRWED
jgi:hypothetical protein